LKENGKVYCDLALRWLKRVEASKERRARRQNSISSASLVSSDDELYSSEEDLEEETTKDGEKKKRERRKNRKHLETDEFSSGIDRPQKRRRLGRSRQGQIKSEVTEPSRKRGRPQKPKPSDQAFAPGKEEKVVGAVNEDTRNLKERPEYYMKGYIVPDCTTEVCTVCGDGGSLLCCEGRCHRAFHLHCLKLSSTDVPEDTPWLCSDCQAGIQICFGCNIYGDDPNANISPRPASKTPWIHKTAKKGEVFQCSHNDCGRFYHMDCVAENCLAVFKGDGKFICPLHACAKCRGKQEVSVQCIRCSNAYHSDCLDRERTLRLHLNLIICDRHFPDNPKFNPKEHAAFEHSQST